MSKEVIYIDVDDDITAVVEKVNSTKEDIVAIVPSKKIGALRSAVNLRILKRAAKSKNKQIVLVTNSSSLIPLAAGAEIPVAKSLQSKPEVPQIDALKVDDDDDIIEGAEVDGNFEDKKPEPKKSKKVDLAAAQVSSKLKKEKKNKKDKDEPKVPNFSKFRKRLFIVCGLLLLIVGLIIWISLYTPSADIKIKAKARSENFSTNVTFGDGLATNVEKNTLKSITQTTSEDRKVDFNATGSKEVGEKATGKVVFSTDSIRALGQEIPAGTEIQSESGAIYTTDASITMGITNAGGVAVKVTAKEIGDKYNGASGSASGAPSGVSVRFSDATSGGSSKTVKIVTQEDVQKASAEAMKIDEGAKKKELESKFGKDMRIIDGSFKTSGGNPTISPNVGEEAKDGKASLSVNIVSSLSAVNMNDIKQLITTNAIKNESKENDRKVYNAGDDNVTISKASINGNNGEFNLATSVMIGPSFSEKDIKNRSKNKRAGEIQEDISSIPGVKDVSVKIKPFWISKVPDKDDVINVDVSVDTKEKN